MEKTMKGMMIKSAVKFCLIPFFFLWISFAVSTDISLKNNIKSEQQTIVRFLGILLENYFYEMEEAMEKVSSDAQVQKILKNVDRTEYNSELYNAYKYVLNIIGKTCFDLENVENIILADMNGGHYSIKILDKSVEEHIGDSEKIKEEIYEHHGKTWIAKVESENGSNFLILSKPIMDLERLEFIGMMYFVIDSIEIGNLLKVNLGSRDAVMLVDQKNQRIYMINEKLMESSDAVITKSESNNYGVSVVTGVSVAQYGREMLVRQFLLLVLFVVITIPVFIVVQYIYQKINGEISGLLQLGEKNVSKDTTYFEIRQLNDEMMSLIQKNNEGKKKIVKLMNHCDMITLDKLQAQINPHFLYNTLTSIKYIAMENEQKQISELITSLIKLLRSTINRDGDFVTLVEEAESVKNYMRIQNIIYKGNVEFDIHIPETIGFCMVPNFILQPLVENSLFHGIHPEEEGGKINISADEVKQGITIKIRDNGDGFSEECLVNMMGAENNKEMMTNFGLKGVQQKIQLLCGGDFGIFVTSTKNIGSTVEIILPKIQKEGERELC